MVDSIHLKEEVQLAIHTITRSRLFGFMFTSYILKSQLSNLYPVSTHYMHCYCVTLNNPITQYKLVDREHTDRYIKEVSIA